MVSLETPVCDFGTKAIDFTLPGVDDRTWSLQECMGEKGLLIMFICNHCPYVKAVQDRIVRDALELKQFGIESVAIMSNDPTDYPDDSFENMKLFAQRMNFSFPYLFDESQTPRDLTASRARSRTVLGNKPSQKIPAIETQMNSLAGEDSSMAVKSPDSWLQ